MDGPIKKGIDLKSKLKNTAIQQKRPPQKTKLTLVWVSRFVWIQV